MYALLKRAKFTPGLALEVTLEQLAWSKIPSFSPVVKCLSVHAASLNHQKTWIMLTLFGRLFFSGFSGSFLAAS